MTSSERWGSPFGPERASAQSPADRSSKERSRPAQFLVIGAGLLVLLAIAPVAVGLAGAVTLYELGERPYARLARHVDARLASAIIVAAALILVAAPFLWLGYHLSTRLPSALATIDGIQRSLNDGTAAGGMATLGTALGKAKASVQEWLPSLVKALGGRMSWALLNWSIALLGVYYLLLSGSTAWQRVKALLPFSSAGSETLRVRLHDTSIAIVAGTLLSSAVQGASVGAGFYLAGIPEAVFWGLCAAITTLVPIVSNGIVWIPGLLYTIAMRNYSGAIAIGILGGVAPPLIDRVVRSSVSSRMGRVHPMTTLVGALAGVQVAGVAGLILGPVALDMFFALADVYSREYLTADGD